jgi:hypothetical protein
VVREFEILELLRRAIAVGAPRLPARGGERGSDDGTRKKLGEAKIGQCPRAICQTENVVRFYVTVNDSRIVKVERFNTIKNSIKDSSGIIRRKKWASLAAFRVCEFLSYVRGQRTLRQIHYVGRKIWGLIKVVFVDADDVWMTNGLQSFYLASKSGNDLGICQRVRLDYL